jgi:hypothetical protein
MTTGASTISQIAAPSPPIAGGIYRAVLGTALPTDTTTALNSAFATLGYVDDDGVTLKIDRPNTKQYAWGGSLVVSLQEHVGYAFAFKLFQILDPDVMMAVHSDSNVTVTPPTSTVGTLTTTTLNAKLNINSAWVITGFYQLTGIRWAMPNARITVVGDMKITHKALAEMDCTLECFPDNSGNYIYQITNDGVHT